MKQIILVSTMVLPVLFSIISSPLHAESESCGFPLVKIVDATEAERSSVCKSVGKIAQLMGAGVARADLKMTVSFADDVFLPAAPGKEPVTVFGYFDSDTSEVFMTHFNAKRQKQKRKPWGFDWNTEFAESFLLHEISHVFIVQYLGPREKSISHSWHESIAYWMQFELMAPELRTRILTSVAVEEKELYTHPAHIYSMEHRADPERFAVRGYLSIHRWGSAKYVIEVLDGKIQGVADNGW